MNMEKFPYCFGNVVQCTKWTTFAIFFPNKKTKKSLHFETFFPGIWPLLTILLGHAAPPSPWWCCLVLGLVCPEWKVDRSGMLREKEGAALPVRGPVGDRGSLLRKWRKIQTINNTGNQRACGACKLW